jgi:hypothetical protein
MTLQETVQREVQHHAEAKQRQGAIGFLDRFVRLFADYSHHDGRSHKRKPVATSSRSSDEIVGELIAFQKQKPRPWRPAGNRQRLAPKMRFKYRRAT